MNGCRMYVGVGLDFVAHWFVSCLPFGLILHLCVKHQFPVYLGLGVPLFLPSVCSLSYCFLILLAGWNNNKLAWSLTFKAHKKVFLHCQLVAAWGLILMRGATLNALHHLVASHDTAQWLIKVLQKPVGRTATSFPQRKSISSIVCSLSNVKMPSATAESKLNPSISLLPAWLLRATCSRYFLPLRTKQMLIGYPGLKLTKNAFHIKTCQDGCATYLTGTLSDPSALQR